MRSWPSGSWRSGSQRPSLCWSLQPRPGSRKRGPTHTADLPAVSFLCREVSSCLVFCPVKKMCEETASWIVAAARRRSTAPAGAAQDGDDTTQWGELDVLVVDMPPGIADAALDAVRLLRRAEHLVIATGSRVVVETVRRTLRLLKQIDAPIVGLVENMRRGDGEPQLGVWLMPDPLDVDSKQTTFVWGDEATVASWMAALYPALYRWDPELPSRHHSVSAHT